MGASGPNQLAFFLVPLYTPPLNLVQIGVTLGGPWDKRDGPTDIAFSRPAPWDQPGTGKNQSSRFQVTVNRRAASNRVP